MAPRGFPGQSVQYHQLGGQYLSHSQPDAPGNYRNPGQPGISGNYASHEPGNPAGQEGYSKFVSSFKGAILGLAQWLPGLQGAGIPNNPSTMDQMNPVHKQM